MTSSSGASDVTASGNARPQSIETLASALTERERQIRQLVCDGCSDKEIGRRLDLSEDTVKAHIHNIYEKLASALAAVPAMAARSRE
jgi:two-component system nitrate/nitrite response regulator NarL